MQSGLDWSQFLDLVKQPPRPFEAVVAERIDGVEARRATVIHDGREGWIIDDGSERHITFSAESSLLISDAGVTFIEGKVATGGWLKFLFRGELLDLELAAGEVHDERCLVLERECVVATVTGLRRDEPDAVFELTVDVDDGIILEARRADTSAVLSVESLTTSA